MPRPAPEKGAKHAMGRSAAAMPMQATQSLVSALWRTDGSTVAKIHIKNAIVMKAVPVIVTLFMEDGTALALDPVIVPASGEATVNLNQALASAPTRYAGHVSTEGTAQLDYQWEGAGHITASLNLKDLVHSLSFSQPFVIAAASTDMMAPMGSMAAATSNSYAGWKLVNARYLARKISEPPAETPTIRLRALWWKHDPGVRGYFTLANQSATELRARYRVTGRTGAGQAWRQTDLAPHALQRFDLEREIAGLPAGEASGGGIEVEQLGESLAAMGATAAGGLAAAGWLENPAEGFSANIEFSLAAAPEAIRAMRESGPAAMSGPAPVTLAAAGLMLGKPMTENHFPDKTRFTPYGFLRNATDHTLGVDVDLNLGMNAMGSMAGMTSPAAPPPPIQLELAPGELRELPLPELAARLAQSMGEDLSAMEGAMLNWSASFTGLSGDLLLSTGSTDQTGNYVFEVMPQRVGPSAGEQLPYWNTANGNDTMYSLWNPGSDAQDVVLSLNTADGKHAYNLPLHLAPGASSMVDLAMLRMAGTPDRDGNLLPPGANDGSAMLHPAHMPPLGPDGRLVMPKGGPPQMNVVLSFGIFNVATATCCADCGACCFFSCPNVFGGDIALGDSLAPVMTVEDCNGFGWDCSADASWTWDEGLFSNNGDGTFTGISVGAGDFSGSADMNVFDPRDPYCLQGCAVGTLSALGGGTVAPVITSLTLTFGLVGTQKTFSIQGSGLTGGSVFSSPTIQVSGTGGVSTSIQSASDSSISINLNSTPGTSSGDVSLDVLVNGIASNAKQFLIQIPSHLVFTNTTCCSSSGQGPLVTLTNGNVVNCLGMVITSGVCGLYRNVSYQLEDQNGGPILDSYTIQEILSNFSTDITGDQLSNGNSATVPANSPFYDNQSLGEIAPNCLGSNDHDSFTQSFSVQVGSTAYALTTAVGIARGYFSGSGQINVIISTP